MREQRSRGLNLRSLRFQLIVWYAGLLTGIFVLLGFAMYFGLRHYLVRNLRESLDRRGGQIAQTLRARIDQTGEAYVIDEINARYAPEAYNRFIRITRQDGRVLYSSKRSRGSRSRPSF